jgi:transcriptional regulator with XRE-family HTH domain
VLDAALLARSGGEAESIPDSRAGRRCGVSKGAGPTVERRRLALELRRLRAQSQRTIHDVAARLECSAGKVSRIETGAVGVRIQDVREMLDLYGVHGQHREDLLELVRRSRRRAWWHGYTDVVPPDSAKFYGLEDGAATIDEHRVALVPGLLQTDRYARALIGAATDAPAEVVERRIALRRERRRLLERPDPPTFTAVLGEAVLYERIGGPHVLAEQLRYLVEAASRPAITIMVRPFDRGAHPASGVPFVLFGFADPADPSVAYLEMPTRNIHIDAAAEVDTYRAAFATARAGALSSADSLRLIAAAADRLG